MKFEVGELVYINSPWLVQEVVGEIITIHLQGVLIYHEGGTYYYYNSEITKFCNGLIKKDIKK